MKLSYSTYFNKVYGGWLGKCIGGVIGTQVEGKKELHSFTEENVFPKEIPPNDDLDLQVLWLHTIQQRGLFITSRDLAEEWIEHCWYWFNEYGRFLKNFLRGIDPPTSGWFDNEYFCESMGCPIRSEIWGFIFPGNPDLATKYAEMDGVLDHHRNSVWAEKFYSAIESMVFFEDDIEKLIHIGLNYVPKNSRLYNLISLVLKCWKKGLPWKDARNEVLKTFGSPDFTSVFQNVGFTLIALLWGNYDFSKTMLIAINSGYDTDCTCATAGAILGAILGANRIPEKWKAPLNDEFVMGFDLPRKSYKISYLAKETCDIGILATKVINDKVEIINAPEVHTPIRLNRRSPPIEIQIDYLGLPAIRKGQEKDIAVILKNNLHYSISGILSLEVPKGWSASEPLHIILEANERTSVKFKVKAPSTGILWDKNIITAVLQLSDGTTIRKAFGLCGARLWKVIGPFWKGIAPYEDRASIDEEYIDEALLSSQDLDALFKNCEEIPAPTSLIPLDEYFPVKTEYAVYLYHKFYCPDERQVTLVIGANGPIKVWANGRFLGKYEGSYIWHPLMYKIDITLKRGVNSIVIKYVKKTESAKISFDIFKDNVKRLPGFSVWQIDLGSILN